MARTVLLFHGVVLAQHIKELEFRVHTKRERAATSRELLLSGKYPDDDQALPTLGASILVLPQHPHPPSFRIARTHENAIYLRTHAETHTRAIALPVPSQRPRTRVNSHRARALHASAQGQPRTGIVG